MFHPDGPTFLELARQALSSTRRGYDLLAPKFDRTPFRTPDTLLDAVAPYIGAPGSIGSALDLCCGTGAAMKMLRPLCRERVVGVDFSQGMLDQARRGLAGSDGPELRFVRADVLELDLGRDFDLVTCFGALGHFERRDQPRLVAAAARALRPGGRLVFVSCDPPPLGSRRLWLSLGFNAAMAVRNVWRPRFVMYYLSFLLPRARRLLREHGFDVEVHRGFAPEVPWASLVLATRQAVAPPSHTSTAPVVKAEASEAR